MFVQILLMAIYVAASGAKKGGGGMGGGGFDSVAVFDGKDPPPPPPPDPTGVVIVEEGTRKTEKISGVTTKMKEEIEAEKKFTVGPQVPECHEQVDRRNRCIMALHDESNFTGLSEKESKEAACQMLERVKTECMNHVQLQVAKMHQARTVVHCIAGHQEIERCCKAFPIRQFSDESCAKVADNVSLLGDLRRLMNSDDSDTDYCPHNGGLQSPLVIPLAVVNALMFLLAT